MSAGRAVRQRSAGTREDARRVRRQQLDGPHDPDPSRVDQPVEHQRHARLEADDAERRAVELDELLVRVVRRVVGGDHVDGAVGDPSSMASRSAASRSGGFIFTFVS